MNYSLSSTRNTGDYTQKIITINNDVPKANNANFLTQLKQWHNIFADLDATGRTTGTIEFDGLTESFSNNSNNGYNKANITITALSLINGIPNKVIFSVDNLTIDNVVSSITQNFNRITGSTITNINNFILSALINLY